MPPDLYVLAVAREGGAALAFLAFLGGVSAATAMVVVETLALSILVSHHLLAPLLLRRQALGHLLLFRRGTVLAVLLLAYLYFRLAGEAYALVGMGLISFVAVAQLAPAGLLGLFWQGSTREGALAGLFGGILVWAYTLLLPALVRSGWLPQDLFAALPSFLHPEGLLGCGGLTPWSTASWRASSRTRGSTSSSPCGNPLPAALRPGRGGGGPGRPPGEVPGPRGPGKPKGLREEPQGAR